MKHIMNRPQSFAARAIALLALLGAVFDPAEAARLTPADKAWIDKCVADRKQSGDKPAALRKYCTCMHAIVEDNQPFGVTELERSYPPAHESCARKYTPR
jgi:hypothetical protein